MQTIGVRVMLVVMVVVVILVVVVVNDKRGWRKRADKQLKKKPGGGVGIALVVEAESCGYNFSDGKNRNSIRGSFLTLIPCLPAPEQ